MEGNSSSTPAIQDTITNTPGSNLNLNATTTNMEQSISSNGDENQNPIQKQKRAKTSVAWSEFKEMVLPNGTKKAECIHCKVKLCINATGSTTQFNRHLSQCLRRKASMGQQHISFPSAGNDVPTTILPALSGKFDMSKMRELITHWVLMHEHPFTVVEEEGLNNMIKYGIPGWTPVSRHTCKKDCMKVYESEKAKLKTLLKTVTKISLTTDLWNSGNQKMEYMTGIAIADGIFKCLMGWGIENKENFEVFGKLFFGGNLFHVRFCAHILNLIVQDGLHQIRHIIDDIYESVLYINSSESRFKVFSKIVQQLKLSYWKLILHCKTRWNSTYEMLAMTIKFKKVFPRVKERDINYHNNPSDEDWEKVEKVCEVLKKFDKYWGECNVLMSVAAVLDPRLKMKVIQWAFPKMYSETEGRANMVTVQDALYELYGEYVQANQGVTIARASTSQGDGHGAIGQVAAVEGAEAWDEFSTFLDMVETVEPSQSELDCYLGEGCHKCVGDHDSFDALQWWKANSTKFPVLSMMAREILAIPITMVASESAFSARSRVIDSYRASLSPATVEMLLCGCDWCRTLNGVKKECKKEEDEDHLEI
ncbi:zinc finger BED domain-containing protein RICESLEEPER 2-like [Pistacia vera]|uniref:zinc finger BED domain-containing protein RICESLEEPER 2-like n=1 Tax=Pistacia vera TaxID=55513 RepID=UPI001263143D|nr:zinc finger BED domain-containing protein RICESLEEPER 2-like [Pistacia vera]